MFVNYGDILITVEINCCDQSRSLVQLPVLKINLLLSSEVYCLLYIKCKMANQVTHDQVFLHENFSHDSINFYLPVCNLRGEVES